jgi:hypothetical protein
MKNTDEIEKMFEETFALFEVLPPDELKSAIDQKINFVPNSKKRFWGLGSFLILAFIGSGLFVFFNSNKKLNTLNNNKLTKELPNKNLLVTKNNKNEVLNNKLVSSTHSINYSKNKMNEEEMILQTKKHERTKDKTFESDKLNSINKNKKTEIKSDKKSKLNSKKRKKAINKNKNIRTNSEFNIYAIEENNRNLISTNLTSNNKENNSKELPDKDLVRREESIRKITENVNTISNINDAVENNQETEFNNENKAIDSSILTSSSNSENVEIISQNQTELNSNIKNKKTIKLPFMFSLATGTFFTKSFYRNNSLALNVKEKNNFQAQFDVTYLLKKSNFSVQTGINLSNSMNEFTFNQSRIDSIFNGYVYQTKEVVQSMIFIEYGNRIDTIITTKTDTISSSLIYDKFNVNDRKSFQINTTNFTIPILLRYSQSLINDKLYFDLNSGVGVSFLKTKFSDPLNVYNNQFTKQNVGLKGIIKTHIRYQFSQFGISLNSNFLYDFKATSILNTTRNRLVFDLGIGLHYSFK